MADELDPATAEVDYTDDLRAIAAVSETIRADEARLREAVEVRPVMEPERGCPGGLPASSPAAVHRQDARLTDRLSPVNCYVLIDRCGIGAPTFEQAHVEMTSGVRVGVFWTYTTSTRSC